MNNALRERDLNLLLSKSSSTGLHAVLDAARAGRLRSGSYAHCVMHYLSAVASATHAVNHKRELDPWLRTLSDNEKDFETLRAAARRLVRAFDEANPQDGLILDAPLDDYYARFGRNAAYLLSKEFVVDAVTAELKRRDHSLPAPASKSQAQPPVSMPV